MDPNNPANQGGVLPVSAQADQSQVTQPVQSAVQQSPQPAEPVAPVVPPQSSVAGKSDLSPADIPPPPIYTPASSSQGKEFAPISTVQHEGLRASEVEPELHPEVKEAGVEKVSEVPNLTLEDKKAGIELAKETTPLPSQQSPGITLPIPPQQAVVIAKKGNVKDSIAWLATLLLRQLKIVRMNKKEGHG